MFVRMDIKLLNLRMKYKSFIKKIDLLNYKYFII